MAIIPVIFIIYAYFSQFAVEPEEEKKELTAVENYVKLLRKRIQRLRKEFSDYRIKEILREEEIDEDLIEKSFR